MKRLTAYLLSLSLLAACSSDDPIPPVREELPNLGSIQMGNFEATVTIPTLVSSPGETDYLLQSKDEGSYTPEVTPSLPIVPDTGEEAEDVNDPEEMSNETRVTITGDDYTHFEWEEGDMVSVFSTGGIGKTTPAVMVAQESGNSDVTFKGNFDYVADVDNYFALYPASADFHSYTFTKDYSQQDGTAKNAALLTACAVSAPKENVEFHFSSANTLLHVAIKGDNVPAINLRTVRLRQLDGSKFNTGFTYDIISQVCQSNFTTSEEIIVTNPDPTGFFIALPPDTQLKDFALIFESSEGIVARCFWGNTFRRATTYSTEVLWELPTVTCGARSSYDYFLNDADASRANQLTTCEVLLGELWDLESKSDAHSTYSGIQSSMITKAGVHINGKDYELPFANGIIGYNTAYYITVYDGLKWGEYKAKAFIETRYNGRIESPEKTIQITGIPYRTKDDTEVFGFYTTLNEVNSHYFPWEDVSNEGALESGQVQIDWDGVDGVWMEGRFREPKIASPKFHIPANTEIPFHFEASVDHDGLIDATLSVHIGSGSAKVTEITSFELTDEDSHRLVGDWDKCVFTPTNNRIICHHEYGASGPKTEVEWIRISYVK